MNKLLLFFFSLLVWNICTAQENVSLTTAKNFRDSIGLAYSMQLSPDSISKTLFKLASPEFEGRETGQPGQRAAAQYLADKYSNTKPLRNECTSMYHNEKTPFRQKHVMALRSNKGRNLTVNDENFLYGRDFIYQPPLKDTTLFINKLIFVANKSENLSNLIKSDRYSSKNILLFDNENLESPNFFQNQFYPEVLLIITEENKINTLFNSGFINQLPFSTFYITEKVAKKFFEDDKYEKLKSKGKRKSVVKEIECDLSVGLVANDEPLWGQNVVATLNGIESGGETIIISSHYDHLGKIDSVIYPGADDNASGTSAVAELARVFSKAAMEGFGPKRNIIFLNVSGEEKGLYGSSYFVAHPTVPLNNIVADLNIDMIGRIDSIHDSTGVKDYIYVIGADRLSTELNTINEEQNKFINLDLDYKYNSADDPNNFYRRSDHYNFAKNGIPVIFYFDGKHADYHRPSDSPEKIDLQLLTKRARLIFLTAWELANRESRIIVDKK